MNISTDKITYRFTIPADGEPGTHGSTSSIGCAVHVLSADEVTIEFNGSYDGGYRGTLPMSLAQFNLLRAKIFEVTGKVV